MTYQTTITSKGQITIPKDLRKILGLQKVKRVTISFEPKSNSIQLAPTLDFLEVVKNIHPRKRKHMDVLKAREFMEKNYERS